MTNYMKSGYMKSFIDFAVKMIQVCDDNNFEQLNELLVEAEEFFLECNEHEKIVRLYISLHERIHSKGNYEKLMEYLERFISFYELAELQEGKNHYLSSIAFLEHIRGNESVVLSHVKLAFEENEKSNNIIAKAAILNNMAYTYFLLEDFEKSFSISIDCEKMIKEYHLDGTFVHYKIGINLAKVYIKKNMLEEAKRYLDEVIKYDEFKASVVERIDYYATFAEYEASIGLITEAIEHYKVAIKHAEDNNMYIEQKAYYLGFLTILTKNKYFEDAAIYRDKYKRIVQDLEVKNKNLLQKKEVMDAEIKRRLLMHKSINKLKQKQLKQKRIKQKQFKQNHIKLTSIDDLTETFNELYMDEVLTKLNVNRWWSKTIHIIFLKVDDLKIILDTYGQIYAEKMVYEFSKMLKECFNQEIIGRTRFNEFLIIDRHNSEEAINRILEELRVRLVKEKVILSKKPYALSMIGVVVEAKNVLKTQHIKSLNVSNLTDPLRSHLSKDTLFIRF